MNLNFPDLLTPLTEKGHVSLKMRKRRVSDSCRLLTAAPLLQKEYLSLDAHRPSRGDGERENERRGVTQNRAAQVFIAPQDRADALLTERRRLCQILEKNGRDEMGRQRQREMLQLERPTRATPS